jgi:UDP-2,3-diacylglucosamine hydrolase
MPFLGKEDPLVMEAERLGKCEDVDYFIFGHNHCAEVYDLEVGGKALFLGHWFEGPVYASLDEQGIIRLHK